MNCVEEFVRNFLIHTVALPILIFSTPFRWIFDFFTISHPDIFRSRNTPSNHNKKVQRVQSQVKEWNQAGRKQLMCTARPGWQTLSARVLNKSKFAKIKIDLEDIIEIDSQNMVLRVEPGMKMGTLTRKLLPQGWTIPVIPEFETLTIGGCVNGTGIETSSHKYGLFAESCVEFEIVIADGSLIVCSKTENADLFHNIPWSHGTLGFLTAVTIPIQRAAKYVKLEYHPTKSIEAAQKLLKETDHDFVEGIMFNLNKIVVMHGKMVDEPESTKVNCINRWYKPWFYKHVEGMLCKGGPTVDYIPIGDYYHRHQRCYFWETATVLSFGNNPWVRYLFGWIFPLNFQAGKIFSNEYLGNLGFIMERHILQDFLIPMGKLKDAVELSHAEVEVYPIWLCPCKFFKTPGLAPLPLGCDEEYIDIGIYGISPKTNNFNIEAKTRKFEKFTTECGGYQFLYADTYMTREEFRKMFHMENYSKIRQKYNCNDAFPEIYDKVSRQARPPVKLGLLA